MNRLKCVISYDGVNFSGFQSQLNGRTIQDEIERALKKIHKGEFVGIQASGRTDAGVHAVGQVIHFDSPLTISEYGWIQALNTSLPADIVVKEVQPVDGSFHARYDAVKKEYRYFISTEKIKNVFRRNYCYHYPYSIQLDKMKETTKYLIGTHDFTSFCSMKTNKENKIRTIYELEIVENTNEIVIRFVGDGFLYNMIRIIIGTLLNVGQGKLAPTDVERILEAKDREAAGKTAPGHGLYLWKVWYK